MADRKEDRNGRREGKDGVGEEKKEGIGKGRGREGRNRAKGRKRRRKEGRKG